MNKKLTPFEDGLRNSAWTLDLVYERGFSSARACLARCEQVYAEGVADLPALRLRNAAYADAYAECIRGKITGERIYLGALIQIEALIQSEHEKEG